LVQKLERIIAPPKDALCVGFSNQGRPSEKPSKWVLLLQTYRKRNVRIATFASAAAFAAAAFSAAAFSEAALASACAFAIFSSAASFSAAAFSAAAFSEAALASACAFASAAAFEIPQPVSCMISILQYGALLSRRYSESHVNAIDRASENWLAS
jgi:hypothetical protein